ncbi:hypothetical protein GCM10010218_36360 [Streptomyces mashuensis]|uniref:Uncharacterized protein n=1 Tax=Streptomyces mashuensis TaxID=33904 RepID=A0A919EDS3_9ACTN|nr:VC0807 family protein [Streptomyces mashuensis]GHF51512.1 hypothetical protein GCM10010218_36360 [Streptomyces mashuensis]
MQTLTPQAPAGTEDKARDRQALRRSLRPLLLDAVLPMGAYYALHSGFGMSDMAALAWSGVLPLGRTVWSAVTERRLNGLAALVLGTTVVGLLLSLVTGDARMMLAKDSAGSGVVGLGVLVALMAGRPLMTEGLKPWITKGDAVKEAAWARLSATSAAFRGAERRFSAVWGTALLGEAVLRVVGVYLLPVGVMVWLGTVILVAAIFVAMFMGGALAVVPMEKMVAEEVTRP